MLNRIDLKFGSTSNTEPLSWNTAHPTIVIGPNGSGKSLLLLEIEAAIKSGDLRSLKIISGFDCTFPTVDEAKAFCDRRVFSLTNNEHHVEVFNRSTEGFPSPQHFLDELSRGQFEHNHHWIRQFRWLQVARLDGIARLGLLNPVASDDLQKSARSLLGMLFRDDKARLRLRENIYGGIQLYAVIDATGMQKFRMRLSNRPPMDIQEERGLDTRAVQFHRQSPEITEASDGTRAYAGLLAAAIGMDAKLLLIDEPEAFLHPPLAERLGRQLVRTTSEAGSTLIAATHSSHFLRGCILAQRPVSVVRLTFDNEGPTARMIDNALLSTTMRDPLLRTTRVFDALFCRGAVVTEGDVDRALYEEINARLDTDGNPFDICAPMLASFASSCSNEVNRPYVFNLKSKTAKARAEWFIGRKLQCNRGLS